ncbi:hypothetical protein [Streptomyces sp. NPDC005435]|uniref:hypothetical protein n=1 Tax=Streptomyces sp. NPDC005435 TaxID=3154464 RepID=UPI0034526447
MDPVSVALLVSLAGGAGGELGKQAWAGLSALVRRPFRRGGADGDGDAGAPDPALPTGEAELARLDRNPDDQNAAHALSTALAVRSALDTEFRAALTTWQEQANQVRVEGDSIHNSISGGVQHAPVLQGRDFSGLTVNHTPTPPPPAQDGGRSGDGRPSGWA